MNEAGLSWSVKEDDFFPYADRPYAYWTGELLRVKMHESIVTRIITYIVEYNTCINLDLTSLNAYTVDTNVFSF